MPRRNATLMPMRRLAGLELNALLYAGEYSPAPFRTRGRERSHADLRPEWRDPGSSHRSSPRVARPRFGYADTAASPELARCCLRCTHGQA